jgi:thiol-disulfide isomerase/thioredoxin
MKWHVQQLLIILYVLSYSPLSGQKAVPVPLSVNQTKQTIFKPISIGDKCPDFLLKKVINFPKKSTKLSDFKGKWLILDFWFTNCQPCLAMLPKCEALQKKFEGKIQFMPITFNSEIEVRQLFLKMNEGKGVNYPSVVEEKEGVRQLFPHTVEPHYVWIDPTGIVRGITSYKDVNEQNIMSFIDGKEIKLPIKDDKKSLVKFDYTKPLLIDGNGGGQEHILFHSILTPNIKGQSSLISNKPGRIMAVNITIPGLYQIAYSYFSTEKDYEFPLSKTIMEFNDTTKYFLSDWQASKLSMDEVSKWYAEHTYCYNLELPNEKYRMTFDIKKFNEVKNTPDYIKRKIQTCKIMEDDLNKVFGIHASIERRKIKCMILTAFDSTKLKTDSVKFSMINDKAYYMKMFAGTVDQFLGPFKNQYFPYVPIVDETNITGRFDIDISTNMWNLIKVNTAIQKYGLKFVEEERELEVLILSDK